jgi:hypothetical protein
MWSRVPFDSETRFTLLPKASSKLVVGLFFEEVKLFFLFAIADVTISRLKIRKNSATDLVLQACTTNRRRYNKYFEIYPQEYVFLSKEVLNVLVRTCRSL